MNTVRLKPEIEEKMRLLASRLGVTVSDIHRTAIDEYLARELKNAPAEGASDGRTYSRWDNVIGKVEGLPDGSTQASQRFP